MIENNPTNVFAAFEILLEEVEAEIEFVNRVGARAFEGRNYDRAREALERAGQVTAFRNKVASLRKEWEIIAAAERPEDEDEAVRVEGRNLGRLRRGLRTREEAYYLPILKILNALGGSGKMSEVLPKVEQIMKSVLKKVDYEPLASDADMPRWRNAAQWARNAMVNEGLLEADSPRGVWAMSEAGRKFLAERGT
jgi:hypothetical protein